MLVKTLHRAFCIAIDGFANDLEKMSYDCLEMQCLHSVVCEFKIIFGKGGTACRLGIWVKLCTSDNE